MGFKALTLHTAFAVLTGAFSGAAFAQWELDGRHSAVQFISTKNSAVAESHSFGSLSGQLSADGGVRVEIALDSVETLIEIRNQRLREILFETASFPLATVTAQVDKVSFDEAVSGAVVATEIPVTLTLHGVRKSLNVPVVVVLDAAGSLLVVTPRPVLINAADFGLGEGVVRLQSIAGLKSISAAVPVSFKLLFAPTR